MKIADEVYAWICPGCSRAYSRNVQEFAVITKKSPGGSIFPYYYKNGELFGAHYEGFARREQGLLERMRAEEQFSTGAKPSLAILGQFLWDQADR